MLHQFKEKEMNVDSNSGREKDEQHYGCYYERDEKWESRRRISKVFIGIAIVAAGALLLLRETGNNVPKWLFSWPMILILAGIASGIKHGFKRLHSYVLLLAGGAFLADRILEGIELRPYLWPIAIMALGLIIIFKPKHRHHHRWGRSWHHRAEKKKYDMNAEDYLDVHVAFGTVTRNVISKNFKGGEVHASFGGTEINLMQSDIEGPVELEMNLVFGGSTLIIPAHWKVRSEQSAVFGGIEDKRPPHPDTGMNENKVLILKGSCVFGGIEIKSY